MLVMKVPREIEVEDWLAIGPWEGVRICQHLLGELFQGIGEPIKRGVVVRKDIVV